MEILLGSGVEGFVKRTGGSCFFEGKRRSRCLFFRVGALRGVPFLDLTLALLIFSVPGISTQSFADRKSSEDFNTLGLVEDNKNPVGLCVVKNPTDNKRYMLVSASRDGKIYTYRLETPER